MCKSVFNVSNRTSKWNIVLHHWWQCLPVHFHPCCYQFFLSVLLSQASLSPNTSSQVPPSCRICLDISSMLFFFFYVRSVVCDMHQWKHQRIIFSMCHWPFHMGWNRSWCREGGTQQYKKKKSIITLNCIKKDNAKQ